MALAWWIWLLLGFALLALELLSPSGFYIFFFGVGAIAVGVLSGLGIAGPGWMAWLLFTGISALCLALFRKPLARRSQTVVADHEIDSLVGQIAVAMGEMGVQEIGQAELRGTAWNARNVGNTVIRAGQRCKVSRVDGLLLELQG